MENLIHRVNVGDMLTRSAATRPAQLAVVDSDRRWTYAEVNSWVNRLAHGLAARGYTRGDELRVAIKAHLDGYKVPKAGIVVDELPKTSTGKIQKNKVREAHAAHYGESRP